MYFIRGTDINGDATRYYSDTIYIEPVRGSSNPNSLPVVIEHEFSEDYLITTFDSTVHGIIRTIYKGKFYFNKEFEFVSGTFTGGVVVKTSGEFTAVNLLNPVTLSFPTDFSYIFDPRNSVVSNSMSEYSQFFPADWSGRPFEDNLVSIGSTSGGSGPSSGGGSSNTPQTLTTTTSVDTLTGIKKKKDIFKFDADPSGQVDKVTGFNAKEKDILSISKSAFKIDRGTFAIANNAKTLAKQLATSVDIVYSRQTGELILNANGAEPGYGDDGGVFAVLMGRPTVGNGSVQFY